MENTKHPVILDINLLSKIMPYYGYAHLMFLLLSKLSKKSRKFLAEWYQEFRGFSLECWEEKNVSINYISKLIEPTDLFKYKIVNDSTENNVRSIITLIDTFIFITYTVKPFVQSPPLCLVPPHEIGKISVVDKI